MFKNAIVRVLKLLIAIMMVFVFLGCEGNSTKFVPIESISLNRIGTFLQSGEEIVLIASIEPENATNRNLIWKSLHEEIATVSPDGVVTGISQGFTWVTASTPENDLMVASEIIVDMLRHSGQLIISIGWTNSIADFVATYSMYKLEHIEVLVPLAGTVLYGFDETLIDEFLFLQMIWADPRVFYAQFNFIYLFGPYSTVAEALKINFDTEECVEN